MTEPTVGMRVRFGHFLLEGERTGTITDAHFMGCAVAVDFLPAEGPENPPGKVIHGCKFFEAKPETIPASNWQYCYPIPKESEP